MACVNSRPSDQRQISSRPRVTQKSYCLDVGNVSSAARPAMFATRSAKRTVLADLDTRRSDGERHRHPADDTAVAGDLVRPGTRGEAREDAGERDEAPHETYRRGTRGPTEHTTS